MKHRELSTTFGRITAACQRGWKLLILLMLCLTVHAGKGPFCFDNGALLECQNGGFPLPADYDDCSCFCFPGTSGVTCEIVACPTGSVWASVLHRCEVCPMGTTKNGTGLDATCETCPEGQTTSEEGADECIDIVEACPIGTIQSGTGPDTTCQQCPQGQTTSKEGATECVDVVPGQWGPWVTGSCSETCGDGVQTRTRHCNQAISGGTLQGCEGSNVETVDCNNGGCLLPATVAMIAVGTGLGTVALIGIALAVRGALRPVSRIPGPRAPRPGFLGPMGPRPTLPFQNRF